MVRHSVALVLLSVVLAGSAAADAAAASASSDDAPVAARPVLPDPLPPGVEGGVIETPVGPARWVHLTGEATTPTEQVVPVERFGDRLLYVGYGGCADEQQDPPCDLPGDPPFLETAPDALAPHTSHPLPGTPQEIFPVVDGATLWLSTVAPRGLWRTTDLQHWEPVDLASLAPEPLGGQTWHASSGTNRLITADGVTLLDVWWYLDDPGALVGTPGVEAMYPEPVGDGVYQLRQSDWGGPVAAPDGELGTVRVEVHAAGLRFRSMSGELLADLPGLDQAFVDDWAAYRSVLRSGLVRIGPDGVSLPDLPGREARSPLAVLPVAEGWLAASLGLQAGPIQTWHSVDGTTWEPGPPLGDADGPFRARSVLADTWHRPAILQVDLEDGRRLGSIDGVRWEPIPPFADTSSRLSSGAWVRWQGMEAPKVSRDGTTWRPAGDVTAAWTPDRDQEGGSWHGASSAVDDARFQLWDREGSPATRDVWILDFAPTPP